MDLKKVKDRILKEVVSEMAPSLIKVTNEIDFIYWRLKSTQKLLSYKLSSEGGDVQPQNQSINFEEFKEISIITEDVAVET